MRLHLWLWEKSLGRTLTDQFDIDSTNFHVTFCLCSYSVIKPFFVCQSIKSIYCLYSVNQNKYLQPGSDETDCSRRQQQQREDKEGQVVMCQKASEEEEKENAVSKL